MPDTNTNLVPFEVPDHILAELRKLFPENNNSDLTEGVAMSFAVVTFRGKVWRVRYKGEDRVIKLASGDPASSIIAVMVKSSPAISKLYYPKTYTEGDDAPPLCYSLDGIRPDNGSVEKQSPTCAACPHNVWGSRVTESGSKAKACADNRRVAIVPYPDLKNEAFGGPMLLRVPPTSLQELWRLGNTLKQSGLPYQAVVLKISFDYELAYPKLVFQAIKSLSPEETAIAIEYMNSDTVLRMLMEPVVGDDATPAEAAGAAPEPAPSKPAPEPAPKEKPAPEPAPAPAEEPTQSAMDLGMNIAMGDPDPAPAKAAAPATNGATKAKPSPAKAAVAPAEIIGSELNSMISGLLGS